MALGGTLHQHLEEVVGHTGHLTMVGEMNANPVTHAGNDRPDRKKSVLDLIDRLHAVRAKLRDVLKAIAELPESEQVSILRAIGANKGEIGQ